MKIKNKKIVIASGSIMIIIMLIGFTYAYWTREFKQSGINENIYECFNITFKEEKSGISLENAYPQSDEDGIKNEAYKVDIENTCPTITSYNVVLNKIKTSTLEDEHVKIAVNNDIKLLSETENAESRIENASEGKIIKTGVLAKGDKKELEIRSWMEESTSEEEGINKNFTYKITIEAVAGGKNLLAAKILTNNTLRTETPDFIYGSPVKNYKEVSEEKTTNITLNKNKNIFLTDNYILDAVENRYYFDYSSMSSSTYQQGMQLIGKYYCDNAAVGTLGRQRYCVSTLYKILEADTTGANEGYITKVIEYKTIENGTNDSGLYKANDDLGVSYYYRGEIKNNYVSFGTYKKDINIYTVGSNQSGEFTFHSLDSASKYCDQSYNTAGLTYASAEECKKSIKIRTNKTNDPIIWRIVRINGDGSIRLIANDGIGETSYASSSSNPKYAGYTYDNEHICTVGNYCTKDNGQSSNMNTYLETWYTENLSDVDNKIQLSNYCNDTTKTKPPTYFGSKDRATAPILTCPNTEQTYGGAYKLKIGLITADELIVGGFNYYHELYNPLKTNYLFSTNNYILTMTPYSNQEMQAGSDYGHISQDSYTWPDTVRPVINLKPDIKITSGDGTKEKPFIIK